MDSHSYPTPENEALFKAVLALETESETAAFFRDLLTVAELEEFSRRWQMVKLLWQGKPYLEIARLLNVSTTTVTRVAHWLNDGMGGYAAVAERMWGKRKG